MKIPLFQVDAFADRVFAGNPAAVCPLETWLDDTLLQRIAAENNLSETAFFVTAGEGFHIRWFTPKAEVDLCGHATLASSYVIFNLLNYQSESIAFQSRSGILTVTRKATWYALNLPADKVERIEISGDHASCFDRPPLEVHRGHNDLMFVFSRRQDIESISPDFVRIAALKTEGVIVTAEGTDTDFVSRYFAPTLGINEDPVTGAAHTTLTPFWGGRLGKSELTARQVSERGGYVKCKLLGDRVEISGQAAFYLSGEITV